MHCVLSVVSVSDWRSAHTTPLHMCNVNSTHIAHTLLSCGCLPFTACCRCPASTDSTDSEALLTATTNKMTFLPSPPSLQPHVSLSVCPTHLWCDPTPYRQWWTRAGRWAVVQWVVKSVIWLKPALNSPPPTHVPYGVVHGVSAVCAVSWCVIT